MHDILSRKMLPNAGWEISLWAVQAFTFSFVIERSTMYERERISLKLMSFCWEMFQQKFKLIVETDLKLFLTFLFENNCQTNKLSATFD